MISLPQARRQPPGEGCGECVVCCVVPGMPELGKPFYSRCYHLKGCGAGTDPFRGGGCGIYDQRPQRCREYRCSWHLGMLGDRVDRRPDRSGLMFQLEPSEDGKTWFLGMYEVQRGAASTDRAKYLCDIILSSKHTRHIPMGRPPVRVYPFGTDLPIEYPVSDRYDYKPPTDKAFMRVEGNAQVFTGKTREIIEPKAD